MIAMAATMVLFILATSLLGGELHAQTPSCSALTASYYEESSADERRYYQYEIPESAVGICRDYVRNNPEDPAGHYHLARALLGSNAPVEAPEAIRPAVEARHGAATWLYATMLKQGLGIPTDEEAALEIARRRYEEGDRTFAIMVAEHAFAIGSRDRGATILREAADQGVHLAIVALLQRQMRGEIVLSHPDEIIQLAGRLLQAGDHYGHHYLGEAHYYGIGTERNYEQAAIHFLQAAEEGNLHSMSMLAFQLHFAQGLPRNSGLALDYASRAAELGAPLGAHVAGLVSIGDRSDPQEIATAFEWFELAFERGYTASGLEIARILNVGLGVTSNPARAREILEDVVAKPNAPIEAQSDLGRMLLLGEGGPPDLKRATDHLFTAATHHSAVREAKYELGRAIILGKSDVVGLEGIESQARQYSFAASILKDAAEEGHMGAAIFLADHARSRTNDPAVDGGITELVGSEPDARDALARDLYQMVYDSGDRDSVRRQLGILLAQAHDDSDQRRGRSMLRTAADQGDSMAAYWLAHLEEGDRINSRLCELQLKLCSSGCVELADGSWIYNTSDGNYWYREDGRLVGPDDDPGLSCPVE